MKLQINVEGALAQLLERIKSRGIVGMTILADPKGQKLKQSGYFRSQFDKARNLAEKRAAELGLKFERFQFRDLRAKSFRHGKHGRRQEASGAHNRVDDREICACQGR